MYARKHCFEPPCGPLVIRQGNGKSHFLLEKSNNCNRQQYLIIVLVLIDVGIETIKNNTW